MTTTNQPDWKCVANLGDRNPIDNGGYFVYVDQTGVYPPEAEWLEEPEDYLDNVFAMWTVYRFTLEPCTFVNGILSDNPFHPGHPAWFAKPESERTKRPQDTTYLKNICDCNSISMGDLVRLFCSEDPIERAIAWRAVGIYHGFDELDYYPLKLTEMEVRKRYEEETNTH